MARGFESKSVESQQTDSYTEKKKRQTPEELERARKRESLELSRTRILNELANAKSEVHRTALRNALDYLDEELKR
ncbi:MAG TPA: hypothetical protein VEK11_17805 [Thermoanaerobaculia bacterium]|nr:hypothetical protein [Thermoanaerobaculia bacterium]